MNCRTGAADRDSGSPDSACAAGALNARSAPVALPAGSCLFLLTDPEGQWTLDEVRQRDGQFRPTEAPVPNFGYSTAAHWGRLRVRNAGPARELLLEFSYAVVDRIDLYIEQGDSFELREAGDRLAFDAREISHRHFIFRIPFAAGENKTLYIRTSSSTSVQIPLALWDWEGFAAKDHDDQALLALYYGMILIMSIYNFWLFFGLRDVSYLYYLGHVLGCGWVLLMQHGLAYEYLWPEAIDWNNRAHALSVYATGMFSLLFCRRFLDLRDVARLLDRFVLGLALTAGAMGTIGMLLPLRIYALITAPLGIALVAHALTAGLVALSRGYRPARFYLLAWSVMLAGVLLLLLRNVGVLPRMPLIDHAATIGSVFDVALLSLALADRLHHMKKETERLNAGLENLVDERTRELRTAYSELQAQDEARTAFFTNISHEIRTPLTLILSPIEMMADEQLDEARRSELLDLMRKNGRGLLKLVNDLLDLSRLEAGRSRFEPRPLNFTALAREVLSNFEQAAKQARLRLEFRNVAGSDITATFDAEKIEKVLFNLIGNAIKFTRLGSDSGGRVTVTVSGGEERVAVSVADTGPGIPRDQHALVFERFRQADSSDARLFEGTGIGLYIVQRYTEMHGGTVRLESEPGRGSTFTLEFPRLAREQAEAHPPPTADADDAPAPAAGAPQWLREPLFEVSAVDASASGDPAPAPVGERLLIVEDNPDLLEFLGTTFRAHYRVLTARDGREGLEQARRHRPDLIVADVMMPHASGMEMLREIREDEALAETPVILLTAKAAPTDRVAGLQARADDYVGKPFHVGELLLRVRNLLYRKRLRELAVAHENQRIYADFHDHLGARLTDLAMLAGRLDNSDLSEDADRETRERLRGDLSALIGTFRDCLAARDDLQRLRENFANGLHMILLRRYVNANRQLHFSADADTRRFLADWEDEPARAALHAACTELATNDIRYGRGAAHWELVLRNAALLVTMRAGSRYDPAREAGHGVENVRQRLADIGAQFENALESGEYRATIRLPF